jgi:methyl-accepting chemotaxis protein
MATDDVLRSLVDTLHIYRESHDRRFDQLDQRITNLGDKIELLAGTLSEVNSTMREFSSITRGQSAVASQQADNIANLIQLAQQQQEAISGLLSRN